LSRTVFRRNLHHLPQSTLPAGDETEVAEKASFVKKFTTDYYDCDVEMTVDKATGRVTHARYKTPLLLSVTVDMFGTHDALLGLTFIKDYTITY